MLYGFAKGGDNGIENIYTSPHFAVCRDDLPGSVRGVGLVDHLVDGFFVAIPFLAVPPIFFCYLPLFEGVLLSRFEAFELGVLVDVEPEFDNGRAEVCEMLFHLVDLLVGGLPFFVGAKGFDSLDEDASVPRAVEDGDFSSRRHFFPEAPEVVVAELYLRRGCDWRDVVSAWVDALDESLDAAAFSGGVPAAEDDDDRNLVGVYFVYELVEGVLAFLEGRFVVLAFEGFFEFDVCQVIVALIRYPDVGGSCFFGDGAVELFFRNRSLEVVDDAVVDFDEGSFEMLCVDGMPFRVVAVGGFNPFFDDTEIGVVLAVASPVLGGDTPGGFGIFFETAKAFGLDFLGNGEEYFHDLDAAVVELALEVYDVFPIAGELVFVEFAFGPAVEHEVIGAAIVELYLAFVRRMVPEAVEERVVSRLLVGGVGGVDFEGTAINIEQDLIEEPAFVGCVEALYRHKRGYAQLAGFALQHS